MLKFILSLLSRADKFKFISSIFLTLSNILYFLPLLFIDKLPDYVEHSILADTVRNKDSLRVANLCSICTSMPLIVDMVLDVFSNSKNLNYKDRLQILLMVIIPGVLFLLFNESHTFPYVAIGLFKLQFGVMIHISISYMVEFAPQPLLPTPTVQLGLFLFYLSNNLQSTSLLVSSHSIYNIFTVLYYISFGIPLVNLIRMTSTWLKYIYELNKGDMSDFKYRNECDMISSYLSVLWVTLIAFLIASSFSAFGNLEKFNEISCLIFIILFAVIAAVLSVLPGKLIYNMHVYESVLLL